MKGDRVEIVVDAGDVTKTYDVQATRAGRRVEIVNRRGLVEVSELTRGGTAGPDGQVHGQPGDRAGRAPGRGQRGARAAAGADGS